ncbi:MAG: hypothetical protein LBD58_10500, partial [Treponema sp.]|nr:hypothetical protein [Treponema sp.]
MMKKRCVQTALAAITAAALAFSAYAETAQTDGISLDEGITRIARALEDALPEGSRVAVVSFDSPSARFSDFALEELQGHLANNRR